MRARRVRLDGHASRAYGVPLLFVAFAPGRTACCVALGRWASAPTPARDRRPPSSRALSRALVALDGARPPSTSRPRRGPRSRAPAAGRGARMVVTLVALGPKSAPRRRLFGSGVATTSQSARCGVDVPSARQPSRAGPPPRYVHGRAARDGHPPAATPSPCVGHDAGRRRPRCCSWRPSCSRRCRASRRTTGAASTGRRARTRRLLSSDRSCRARRTAADVLLDSSGPRPSRRRTKPSTIAAARRGGRGGRQGASRARRSTIASCCRCRQGPTGTASIEEGLVEVEEVGERRGMPTCRCVPVPSRHDHVASARAGRQRAQEAAGPFGRHASAPSHASFRQ